MEVLALSNAPCHGTEIVIAYDMYLELSEGKLASEWKNLPCDFWTFRDKMFKQMLQYDPLNRQYWVDAEMNVCTMIYHLSPWGLWKTVGVGFMMARAPTVGGPAQTLQHFQTPFIAVFLCYRLVRVFFTRDTYPGFITRVLFPEVCDTRVFLVTDFKILTDNEQSPISTHTTYTPHIKT